MIFGNNNQFVLVDSLKETYVVCLDKPLQIYIQHNFFKSCPDSKCFITHKGEFTQARS